MTTENSKLSETLPQTGQPNCSHCTLFLQQPAVNTDTNNFVKLIWMSTVETLRRLGILPLLGLYWVGGGGGIW